MNSSFWRGKRVFLTGHTGFKGSWLALWLAQAGAEVRGFSLEPPTNPSMFEDAQIGQVVASIRGDIRELPALSTAMRQAGPEIVIHMAAQSLVRRSYAEPVLTYQTNVLGTANVVEAVRQHANARAVLIVTTDKCYQNPESPRAHQEDDPLGGRDPYSNSKACAELLTAAYRQSFFATGETRVATARAGNVIGGGDWAEDRLLPDMFRAFLVGKPAIIRNPAAVRPWQHVLEPLGGYLLLLERMWESNDFAEAWNFGPHEDDMRPVSLVCDRTVDLWGARAFWERDPRSHPHESACLKLDSTKAVSRLGWNRRWNLDEALQATVAWHQARLRGEDMQRFSLGQIEDFQRRGSAVPASIAR